MMAQGGIGVRVRPLWAAALVASALAATGGPADEVGWPTHGGDPGHTQYSALRQIDATNVGRLEVAWTYHTGDAQRDNRSQIQCNPIVVGSVLYATSAGLKVFALDAATGKALWTFDPFAGGGGPSSLGVNRGVTYWADGDDERILFTAGSRLYALDARTGKPIATFGKGGSVDLHDGLGRDVSRLFVISNTPGAIYKDLLILGTRVAEGPGPAAPGHIRAYDVRTGVIRWTFHTIPWPGEPGYETWPSDAWQRVGGANAWSGISVDRDRGLVFLPIGSAAFDFWGGDRVGQNLYADCVLVLNAATGERVWHFQTVHHDIWDRDPPAAPVLVTVDHDGRKVDAVAQTTKSGFVFLLDRATGKPLFPVEEEPAPASDLDGESTWPTQPIPQKPPPFARQLFTEDLVTDLSPASHAAVLERLRHVRTGRRFIPPSKEGTVIFPGFDGGAEWGGPAFDPTTGRLYVNANEMAWILTMADVKADASASSAPALYRQYCAACHGLDMQGSKAQNVPGLADVFEWASKADVETTLREGKGVMPAFAYLREEDRKRLAGYLFGEKTEEAAKATDEAESLDKPVGTPYTHTGYNRFLDPDGHPAVKPPWGTLTSIDLNAGTIDWQVPLGELPELTKRGLAPTGTENYGGAIVTAGDLVFIGATKDERFRAFDKKTGKLLWETALPAGGYATPATYEVGGRQYVVIACGGGKMGTKSGDAYVAFALPRER
jgi:quinoprotein glucose dehydrogenase